MVIYKEEKSLEDKIIASLKSNIISHSFKITEDKPDLLINSLENMKNSVSANIKKILAKVAENEHPDLMYGSAILVSTVWNKNDDIFIPDETWKAKDTPVNSPYNNEHEQCDIIGHIIASRVLSQDGTVIAEANNVPNYFDIEVDFVLYKSIYPSLAKTIAENAVTGKTYVSMECTMANFDYGLMDQSGKLTVVARNEDTAFLTKYLRAYGGDGTFNEYKIGRVLKDFRFNGMGNVSDPANPKSHYTRIENISKDSNLVLSSINKSFSYTIEGKTMTVDNLEKANEIIGTLTKEKEVLVSQVETLTKAETDLKATKETLTAEAAKLTISDQKLVEATAKYDELFKKTETLQASLDEANKEIAGYKEEKKKSDRKDKMSKAGVELPEDKLNKILALSDEAFDSVFEFAVEAAKKNKKPSDNDEDDKSEAAIASAAQKDAEKALADVNPEKPGLESTGGEEANKQKEINEIADKLVASVRKNKAQKKLIKK
jgi:hypothetical protein